MALLIKRAYTSNTICHPIDRNSVANFCGKLVEHFICHSFAKLWSKIRTIKEYVLLSPLTPVENNPSGIANLRLYFLYFLLLARWSRKLAINTATNSKRFCLFSLNPQ